MVTFENYKPGLSHCERIISGDYIMNALKHSKVRLPFFYTPCIAVRYTKILPRLYIYVSLYTVSAQKILEVGYFDKRF